MSKLKQASSALNSQTTYKINRYSQLTHVKICTWKMVHLIRMVIGADKKDAIKCNSKIYAKKKKKRFRIQNDSI